jgi:hypothetical protein
MGSLDKREVRLQLDICHHLLVLERLGLVDSIVEELVAIVEELVDSIGSIVELVDKLVVVVPSD